MAFLSKRAVAAAPLCLLPLVIGNGAAACLPKKALPLVLKLELPSKSTPQSWPYFNACLGSNFLNAEVGD
jgi:hypothetical protein